MSHDTLAGLLPWLLVPSTLAALLTLGCAVRDSLTNRTRTVSLADVPAGWTRTVTRTPSGSVVVRLHRQHVAEPSLEQRSDLSVSR